MVAPNGFSTTFRPELFFAFPTLGAGLVCDPLGRPIKRCRIETEGRWDEVYDSLHFDERYIYDDGEQDLMHWAVDMEADGRITAQEASVVGPLISRLAGPNWRVKFRRKGQPPLAGATLTYDARFTQVSPKMVLKRVTIAWGLVPLASLRGYHQHRD
jgi:hypothetical protein